MERKTKIIILLVLVFLIININIFLFFVISPSITGNVIFGNKEAGISGDVISNSENNSDKVGISNPTIEVFTGNKRNSNDNSRKSVSGSGGGGGNSGGGGGDEPIVSKGKVFISPASISMSNNKEGFFYVNISSQAEVFALGVDLLFNKDVIELVSVEEGDFLKKDGRSSGCPSKQIENDKGSLSIACTIMGSVAGVTGDGNIMKVNFKTKSSGISQIQLTKADVIDGMKNSKLISLDRVNGNINVS